ERASQIVSELAATVKAAARINFDGVVRLASLIILGEDLEPRTAFCKWDDIIYADASASLYVNNYEIRIFSRPIGSQFWYPFFIPSTTTYGSPGLIELNALIATQGLSFEVGYEYELKLSIHFTCYGLRVATEIIRFYNCIPTICPTPENLRDELTSGPYLGSQLAWDPVPYASTYTLELASSPEINTTCLCREGNSGPNTSIVVSNPYYVLSSSLFGECFAWRVRSNCNGEELISEFSEWTCYNRFSAINPHGLVANPPSHPGKVTGKGTARHATNDPLTKAQVLNSKVYPNPTSGMLNIELEAPTGFDLQINIYNIHGQLIKRLDKGYIKDGHYRERLSVQSYLSEGLYIFDFQTSVGHHRAKVSVLH
ncbi:MAG: T9SS type A sorting domain-containing protein, partial [Bacteroidota bacterium]